MTESPSLDPTRHRVAILANPRAGSSKSSRYVAALDGALRGRGLLPMVCWEREQLSELAATGESNDLRCAVAAGGDGTLLEVLNRLPGVPVALLPLGNENLVARHCGARLAPNRIADAIALGYTRKMDLGRIDGRRFCVMAGVGIDADVVHRVHERRTGHINKGSYVVPTLRALTRFDFPHVDVTIEETGERLGGAMVFVFNIPEYALGLQLAPGSKPDDGLLDLYVFERPGLMALARYFAAVLCGRQERLPDHHHRTARRLRLESSQPAPVQTDGDPAGFLPAAIEVMPCGLTLVG